MKKYDFREFARILIVTFFFRYKDKISGYRSKFKFVLDIRQKHKAIWFKLLYDLFVYNFPEHCKKIISYEAKTWRLFRGKEERGSAPYADTRVI